MKKTLILPAITLLIIVGAFLLISISSKPSTATPPANQKPVAKSATTTQGALTEPVAPVSGKILFTARPDGVDHIYIMNADGTDITQLTSGPYSDVTAEWSSDGKKIVFQRNEDDLAVYTMNAGGSDVQRISPMPGSDVLPSWSPDGTKIVFTRIISGQISPGQLPVTSLMVMNADGSDPHTIYSDGSFAMEPRYSPDGSKIAFMCGTPGISIDVCIINADGTGLVKLANVAGAIDGDPHWSHDGTKIAFGSNREGGGKLDIFVMNTDGTDIQQLTHFPVGQEAGDTGWSLNDKTIAFEWDENGQLQSDPNAHAEIWLMNADGTDERSTGVQCSDVGCAPRFEPGS